MPTRWQAYRALPRNPNGKVDRPLLKKELCSSRQPSFET
jgi:acyl-coenzyme A synthetase/AMP-(fatty) acid ligase